VWLNLLLNNEQANSAYAVIVVSSGLGKPAGVAFLVAAITVSTFYFAT
jgi:hypothetical protein